MDLVETKIKEGDIHLFSILSESFLFDPTTHSIFSVPSNNLSELKEEIKQTINQGFFIRKEISPFEDVRIFKSLCLMVTHGCNFRCSYCFEKEKEQDFTMDIMSLDVGKKSLELIAKLSQNRVNIEVDFFGGEPLLVFDVVKEIILHGRELEKRLNKRFWFSLTTNASLLNKTIIDFLKEENVSLILSIDGNQQTHDFFRINHNGKGTFHETINGILQVEESGHKGYYTRGTYTKKTPEFSDQVLYLEQLGLHQISFEPVVSKDPTLSFTWEDLPFIRNQYEKLAKAYLGIRKKNPDFRFYHFEVNLEEGACFQKLMTSCGVGVEYLSVSPNGRIYPCHQFDGNPDYELGNVEEGITNIKLVDEFKKQTLVATKDKCNSCWARTLCGGGCLANNLTINNKINEIYDLGCEIQKIRLEHALYVQAKLKNS